MYMKIYSLCILFCLVSTIIFANEGDSQLSIQDQPQSPFPIFIGLLLFLVVLGAYLYYYARKHNFFRKNIPDIDPVTPVIKYIQKQRDKEINDLVITISLQQAGWSTQIIQRAFDALSEMTYESVLLPKYDITKDTYPPLSLYIRLLHQEGFTQKMIRSYLIQRGWPTKIVESELKESLKNIS